MPALVFAVFTASFLGSTHCAGMCGAFVAFALGADRADRPSARTALNAAYNIGRLVTYVTIGAIAGALGAALDLGGSMVGVQRVAALCAGALMLGFGIVAVLRHFGVRIPRAPVPAVLLSVAKRGHSRAFDLSPVLRAATVGMLTTLLPCGWLYAFAITSAGTGNPGWGALTMAAFWLGTLPMMAAIGFGVQSISGPLRKHIPLATSLLLVVVGVWTLLERMSLPTIAADPSQRPSTIEGSLNSVHSAATLCPLCNSK